MEEQSLGKKVINGMVWTSIERFGTLAIQFIISIAIARILSPEDYGIVGMTAIFMAIADILLNSGFSSALIQKKDRNETDYTTCFYFNVIVGLLLYAILYFSAPFIADFYRVPLLTPVCRVLALGLMLSSLTTSQGAKLRVELKFKQLSVIALATTLFSGVIGLCMAIAGWGVWALVLQMVGGSFLYLIFLEFYTKWLPRGRFSYDSFKYLFSFGSKILCSNIINTIYGNLYTLVIGRVFTPAEVGYYNRANNFANLPSQTLLGTVMKVAYPIMSEIQDDNVRLTWAYKKFLRLPLFILYPILAGFVALAEPLIVALIGEKWLPCVPYLQILSVGCLFTPLTHINLNILYVKGRTDLVLKLEVIKKTIAFSILFATIQFGIVWLIVGKAFYELVAYSFNCYHTGKFINFGFWKQMYYNVPIILKSSLMGVACWGVSLLGVSAWSQLFLGFITGVAVYGAIVFMTKDESLYDLIAIIKKK